MKRIERQPSYPEAVKTIKRSIQARGGIADEEKVIQALVWNYYKHLPFAERKKLKLVQPYAWSPSDWIEFRRKLLTEKALTDLVTQARNHLWYATVVDGIVKVVHILNKDNKQTKMLVLPETKITIGA